MKNSVHGTLTLHEVENIKIIDNIIQNNPNDSVIYATDIVIDGLRIVCFPAHNRKMKITKERIVNDVIKKMELSPEPKEDDIATKIKKTEQEFVLEENKEEL
jgi:hypothetical protein